MKAVSQNSAPTEAIDNTLSAYWYAIAKDCPGKTWFHAEIGHPAVYRALKVDPADPAAAYAVAPFRIGKVDEIPHVLAAWPAPKLLGDDAAEDWLGIEAVLAWNPVSNTIRVMGDVEPQLIGAWPDSGPARLFGTAFAFFRAWVEERAAFATAWKAARSAHWLANPVETSTPGMLVTGPLDKIRLPVNSMPRDLECVGLDPREVNRAIMRSARLPYATQSVKVAA